MKKKVTILDASQNDLIPDQPETPNKLALEAAEGEAVKPEPVKGRSTMSSRQDFDELAIKAELAKVRLRAETMRERRLQQAYDNMPEEE